MSWELVRDFDIMKRVNGFKTPAYNISSEVFKSMADISLWIASIPLILGLIKTGHHLIWGTRTIGDNKLGWVLLACGIILLALFMGNLIPYQIII